MHLLTQNKRDLHVQMRSRKTQKESLRELNVKIQAQVVVEEGAKEVIKEMGKLSKGRA